MNDAIPLSLAAFPLLVAVCGCGTGVPNQCPPAATSVSPPVAPASAEAIPAADPPYHSAASLPPHPAKAWMLLIMGDDAAATTHTFQVAENRAVDLPMPAASPWKCRIDAAHVVTQKKAQNNFVSRDVACSNDGWNTRVEATASYCFQSTCEVEENSVELGLPMRHGGGGVGTLRVAARTHLDSAEYPELP